MVDQVVCAQHAAELIERIDAEDYEPSPSSEPGPLRLAVEPGYGKAISFSPGWSVSFYKPN